MEETHFSWRRRAFLGAAIVTALSLVAGHPAIARDVHLGGQRSPNAEGPANVVELPAIVLALRREDGGWHHIRIEAWLAPEDQGLIPAMSRAKYVIVRHVEDDLPGQPFPDLQSPHSGPDLAKDVIHLATEHTLGRPWAGEVLIKTMLVY